MLHSKLIDTAANVLKVIAFRAPDIAQGLGEAIKDIGECGKKILDATEYLCFTTPSEIAEAVKNGSSTVIKTLYNIGRGYIAVDPDTITGDFSTLNKVMGGLSEQKQQQYEQLIDVIKLQAPHDATPKQIEAHAVRVIVICEGAEKIITHLNGMSSHDIVRIGTRETVNFVAFGKLFEPAQASAQLYKAELLGAGTIAKETIKDAATVLEQAVSQGAQKVAGKSGQEAALAGTGVKVKMPSQEVLKETERLAANLPKAEIVKDGVTTGAKAAAEVETTASWGMWCDLEKITYNGRTYAKINNRFYTHEAIDRMTPEAFGTAASGYKARSIPTSVIENVLENGSSREVIKDGIFRTIFEQDGLRVVTEEKGKIIITVMKYGE